MKVKRWYERAARRLFRDCLVNARLDERRVRIVVQRIIERQRSSGLAILSRFQRLVRLYRDAHTAHVESATPLPADVQTVVKNGLAHMYGSELDTSFTENR